MLSALAAHFQFHWQHYWGWLLLFAFLRHNKASLKVGMTIIALIVFTQIIYQIKLGHEIVGLTIATLCLIYCEAQERNKENQERNFYEKTREYQELLAFTVLSQMSRKQEAV